MPGRTNYVYWDSCVFLGYLNEEPDKLPVLDDLLQDIRESNGSRRIVTSTVSVIEVVYFKLASGQPALSPVGEQRLDSLWRNPLIEIADVHEGVAKKARSLRREALRQGAIPLQITDAIHLATAAMFGVQEFYTYDPDFGPYRSLVRFTICVPYVQRPRLPGILSATTKAITQEP